VEFWNGGTRLTPVPILTGSDAEWETIYFNETAPESAQTMTVLLTQHVGNIGVAYYDNVRVSLGNKDEASIPSVTVDTSKYYDPNRKVDVLVEGYPRLYFTKDEKDDFIAKKDDTTKNYAGSSFSVISSAIITAANTYVDEKSFTCSYYGNYTVTYEYPLKQPKDRPNPPTYNNTGKYPYWTALGSALGSRLKYLATAYMLTGDEKYAEKATEICMSLSEWTSWSDPNYGSGNACLDSGYITTGVCTVYDFLYDYFTDEQRSTIQKAIYEKGLVKPMQDWNLTTDHNVQVVLTSGFATAACTLLGEYPQGEAKIKEAINKALAYFTCYLDKRVKTYTHEGNMYTTLSMEYIMYAADAIARVTGDRSIFNHEYISDVLFEWMIAGGESSIGSFALISDGSTGVGFFATSSILNKETGNLYAGYFLKRAKVYSNSLEGLLYGLVDVKYEVPGQDLQSVYLDKIGWGSMRTGWDANDMTLVFTSSRSNLGHNHYDNNSFVLAKDGVWLATDPGYQDCSKGDNADYTLKYGHSTIYVDGKAQSVLGQSTIEEKLTSGFFSYMIGSAEKAYRSPRLTQFDRSFIMVNHETFPYFIIKDDLDSDKEHVYTWRLNVTSAIQARAEGKANKAGTMASGKWFEAEYNNHLMTISFATDSPYDMLWQRYKTTAGLVFDVTDNQKVKANDYLSVLSVTSGGATTINFAQYLDSVKKSSEDFEVKTTSMDSRKMIFVKPTAVGQSVSLPLTVPATGSYKLRFDLAKARSYGSCDIYIGDTFIGSHDGYVDNYLDFDKVIFENVTLEAGDTEITFVAKGSSAGMEKFQLGLICLIMEPQDPEAAKVVISKNIDNDSSRGCFVTYGGEFGANDLILFAKDNGINAENVISDGSFANILGLKENEVTTGYVVTDAKTLSHNGKVLFESPVSASAAITFEKAEGSVIKASSAVDVKLYIPEDKLENKIIGVSVAGESREYKLDENGYLTLSVPKGEAYIDFTFEAPVDENENTGNVPSHIKTSSLEYKYPHDYPNNFVKQQYLPENIKNKKFYTPKYNSKYEALLAEYYKFIEKLKQ